MRIGTVYPDREAYRDPSIQPYFFVVPAEVFQLGIVASPSCTEYHWGTLIALYRAVHQAQLMNWQKTSPSGAGGKTGSSNYASF